MKDNEALYFLANKRPVKLKIKRHFESSLLKLTKIAPHRIRRTKDYPLEIIDLKGKSQAKPAVYRGREKDKQY